MNIDINEKTISKIFKPITFSPNDNENGMIITLLKRRNSVYGVFVYKDQAHIEFVARLSKNELFLYAIHLAYDGNYELVAKRNRVKKVSDKILQTELKQYFDKNKIKPFLDSCTFSLKGVKNERVRTGLTAEGE